MTDKEIKERLQEVHADSKEYLEEFINDTADYSGINNIDDYDEAIGQLSDLYYVRIYDLALYNISKELLGIKDEDFLEDKITFLKSLYAPENTNGYNRHAYIVRDYLKYPLNSYIEYNAKLNAFDDEDALILYIIDNELNKQR
ncbi:MAG: hypothetical protein H8E55_26825 [Pelagibacterales bacterium]|nr:hypothetical protein [Pelagibacterales bacterium]